ncbi:hypothetical protein FOMPIDRAFT_1052675 [Fomitopsis schrenkii]|uniref:F-box domain-containing protein n=1 Tax=Fomitopsis schrenkii TaxID=2126942 RepID=S8DVD4_FOMSC|nr:hypothetical protein FOMPIDRAFT_1052675 [Fomitopsis schrenkii]
MRESPSTLPADHEPYTECPYCIPYGKDLGSLAKLRAPRLSSALEVDSDPNSIDWSDYYWGYNGYNRRKRRTIVRPLPQSITDRIPLELVGHILGFLRRETWDLYNCALVCRDWHHHILVAKGNVKGTPSRDKIPSFRGIQKQSPTK